MGIDGKGGHAQREKQHATGGLHAHAGQSGQPCPGFFYAVFSQELQIETMIFSLQSKP